MPITKRSTKMEKVIYFTQSKGITKGQVFPWSFVNEKTDEEISQITERLTNEGYLDVKVGTWADYEAAERESLRIAYKFMQAQAITADDFKERLNVLPPCRHYCYPDSEGFYMSEQIGGGLYSFYFRLGKHHFHIVAERNANMSELERICAAQIPVAA